MSFVGLPRDLCVCLFSLAIFAAPLPASAADPKSVLAAIRGASAAETPDARLNGAYKFNEGGWTYVHLQGTPEQVGFQHGYLLAHEIESEVQRRAREQKNAAPPKPEPQRTEPAKIPGYDKMTMAQKLAAAGHR